MLPHELTRYLMMMMAMMKQHMTLTGVSLGLPYCLPGRSHDCGTVLSWPAGTLQRWKLEARKQWSCTQCLFLTRCVVPKLMTGLEIACWLLSLDNHAYFKHKGHWWTQPLVSTTLMGTAIGQYNCDGHSNWSVKGHWLAHPLVNTRSLTGTAIGQYNKDDHSHLSVQHWWPQSLVSTTLVDTVIGQYKVTGGHSHWSVQGPWWAQSLVSTTLMGTVIGHYNTDGHSHWSVQVHWWAPPLSGMVNL